MAQPVASWIELAIAGARVLEQAARPATSALEGWVGSLPAIAGVAPALEALRASQHPLSTSLPLLDPAFVLLAALTYLLMIGAGAGLMPWLPKGRYRLLVTGHNAAMTALSGFMGVQLGLEAYRSGYALVGNLVDGSSAGLPMARLIWLFYASKLLEFMDTVIMVLKGNRRQITFLHLYHHVSILLVCWAGTYWAPNGDVFFAALLNSFIHVLMYGYYLLAGLGFKGLVSRVKRYLTLLQISQFCAMLFQCLVAWYMHTTNPASFSYPASLMYMLLWYMCSMLLLFSHFLVQDMRRDAKVRRAAKVAKSKLAIKTK